MIFGVGERIIPNHAGILLVFFNAIQRDIEAEEIQDISSLDITIRERFDFEFLDSADYDHCIREFLGFFRALYTAWKLNVALVVRA